MPNAKLSPTPDPSPAPTAAPTPGPNPSTDEDVVVCNDNQCRSWYGDNYTHVHYFNPLDGVQCWGCYPQTGKFCSYLTFTEFHFIKKGRQAHHSLYIKKTQFL